RGIDHHLQSSRGLRDPLHLVPLHVELLSERTSREDDKKCENSKLHNPPESKPVAQALSPANRLNTRAKYRCLAGRQVSEFEKRYAPRQRRNGEPALVRSTPR